MAKGSEGVLSDLHGAVATVLTHQVLMEEEIQELNLDGVPEGTGEMEYSASPALIATAIKFLKDNSITCDIKVDTNMGNLADALSKKQRHSRLENGGDAALRVVTG
tara:strand:+ start:1035 stop:1352 length:318 start_codon:yes stop_codon:yes gene_type:complete